MGDREAVHDSHVHVVAPDRGAYPLSPVALPNGAWYDEHPLAVESLLASMDDAGVSGAVLVQANGAYGVDNSYAADAAARNPDRLVGVSIVDLAAPDRLDVLWYWSVERQMRGTRLFDIPPSDPSWLDDSATGEVLDLAASLDLRVSVCVLAPQIERLGPLLDRAGGRPVVLDHCGFADFRDPRSSASSTALFALARRHPNLFCKVTPTVFELGLDPGDDPAELLRRLVGELGADRLMWGSDFPQHHELSYERQTDRARSLVAGLAPADRSALLSGTARRVWFDPPSG